jgi:hypothetical protein
MHRVIFGAVVHLVHPPFSFHLLIHLAHIPCVIFDLLILYALFWLIASTESMHHVIFGAIIHLVHLPSQSETSSSCVSSTSSITLTAFDFFTHLGSYPNAGPVDLHMILFDLEP